MLRTIDSSHYSKSGIGENLCCLEIGCIQRTHDPVCNGCEMIVQRQLFHLAKGSHDNSPPPDDQGSRNLCFCKGDRCVDQNELRQNVFGMKIGGRWFQMSQSKTGRNRSDSWKQSIPSIRSFSSLFARIFARVSGCSSYLSLTPAFAEGKS